MMKMKLLCLLMLLGLVLVSFSVVDGKSTESAYNKKCYDWGNKYGGGSHVITTYATKGMSFGQMFRCNGNKSVNTVSLHFSSVTGWALPANKINVSIRIVNTNTGSPLGTYLTSNVSQKPVHGWNTYTFTTSFNLVNNTLYAIYCFDYTSFMSASTNIKVKLISDSKGGILGRSPDGYYEPFDRSFTIARPSSPVIYTEGSMPWCIYNSSNNAKMEGNALDTLFNDQLFVGYKNRQSFIPDYNFTTDSITTSLGIFQDNDVILDGDAWVNITSSSGALIYSYGFLLDTKDICTYPSDRTVYRYYTCYFDKLLTFQKGQKYYFYVSTNATRDNSLSVPRLSSINVLFYNMTYQNRTCNASYSFENGAWNYYPDYDMFFNFHVIRNSLIPSTSISFTENLINCTGSHDYTYNNITGFHVINNYTGNETVCPACNSTNLTVYENLVNCTGSFDTFYSPLFGWSGWANYTGNSSICPFPGNHTVSLFLSGFYGYVSWSGDYSANSTNISFNVSSNMTVNGSVHVDDEEYFLAGMLSFDPPVMILSLFSIFFFIGYESKKRSGGFFMLFAGFLLIALGILIYGTLGYASTLVVPFAIFIMVLGGKKAFYGPETEESQSNKSTK